MFTLASRLTRIALLGALLEVALLLSQGFSLSLAGIQDHGTSVSLPTATSSAISSLFSSLSTTSSAPTSSAAAGDDVPAPDASPFMHPSPAGPGRFAPCSTIHYVVNTDEAPAGALKDTQATLARISTVTHLHFTYDGPTHAIPTPSWATSSPSGYAPLVIAWVRPGQTSLLEKGAAATGGQDFVTQASRPLFISGEVVLDTTQDSAFLPGIGEGTHRGTLLLHELGHVLGLAHTADTSSTMYPTITSSSSGWYSPTDLAHLRELYPSC